MLRVQDLTARLGPLSNPFAGAADAYIAGSEQHEKIQQQKALLEQQKAQAEAEKQYRSEQLGLQRLSLQQEKTAQELKANQEQAKFDDEKKRHKLSRWAEFNKQRDAGNIQGALRMLPELEELGVSTIGDGVDEAGLPKFRAFMSPEERKAYEQQLVQRQSANAQSEFSAPFEMSASGQAQGVAEGGDVVDLGADKKRSDEQMAALGDSIVGGYPEGAPRESAKSTWEGIRRLENLSPKEQAELGMKLQEGPNSIIRGQMNADAQSQRQQAQQSKPPTMRELQQTYNDGRSAADQSSSDAKVNNLLARNGKYATIRQILNNDTAEDDYLVARELLDIFGNKGAQSDKDLDQILGTAGMSAIEKIEAKINDFVYGGFDLTKKEALLNALNATEQSDLGTIYDKADSIYKLSEESGNHERYGAGMRGYVDSTLMANPTIYEGWLKRRNAGKQQAAGGSASATVAPAKPSAAGLDRLSTGAEAVPEYTKDGEMGPPAPGEGAFNIGAGVPVPAGAHPQAPTGSVEETLGTNLGDMKHPAIPVLAKFFQYDPAGGDLEGAVQEYIAMIEADHPEAFEAAKRGDAAGFQKAMSGEPVKPDPDNGGQPESAAARARKYLNRGK